LLPIAIVSDVTGVSEKGIICNSNYGQVIDAIYEENFRNILFHHLYYSSRIKERNGYIQLEKGSALKDEDFVAARSSRVLEAEQSNSSLIYDEKYFLKIFRKLFRETNPDVEMDSLPHRKKETSITSRLLPEHFTGRKLTDSQLRLAMMQQKVTAIKDAWSLAGDYLI
jgi:maltose alpha-D-glucosyltransferase/alpha-amylase